MQTKFFSVKSGIETSFFGEKALEKHRTKRCLEKKPWKNYARNDVWGKSLGKTPHETMFGKKALEKLRTKRCLEKKPWKNYARRSVSPQTQRGALHDVCIMRRSPESYRCVDRPCNALKGLEIDESANVLTNCPRRL